MTKQELKEDIDYAIDLAEKEAGISLTNAVTSVETILNKLKLLGWDVSYEELKDIV